MLFLTLQTIKAFEYAKAIKTGKTFFILFDYKSFFEHKKCVNLIETNYLKNLILI